jgi:hypothetical protein
MGLVWHTTRQVRGVAKLVKIAAWSELPGLWLWGCLQGTPLTISTMSTQ